ncbi:MAG: hypothetical protein ACLQU3_03420 [Limisphaerales bacterium]
MNPSVWQRLASLFRTDRKSAEPLIHIENTVTIKGTDEAGQQHEYHSLDEVPPEVRAEIEAMKSVPWQETCRCSSADGRTTEIRSEKTRSTFKFTDASGTEHIYHSLEEMPPELRAGVEQAMRGEVTESTSG